MASGSAESPTLDEEELRGDGKKRKFKPFEKVRKFFGKGKRKAKDESVSVVAVKATSTPALYDTDDDDGGFKSHQPRPLGGNRSISEDSVFSPEQRETNLQALKKTAVSEESLPKSALQAELVSKLNKRRSQYSDEDEGLPQSPTPPITTADIIMGGPLKPLPAAGKSTSRESDRSLISMDGSENEDDPFKSNWKSSVPSKLSGREKSAGSEGPIDFEKMGSTELLKSDAAKDRISVKPRARKATRKSQKKRDGSSPHSLPSLNEESPTKSQAEKPVPTPKKDVAPRDSVGLEVSITADKQQQQPQVMLTEKGDSSAELHQTAARQDSSGGSQLPKPAPLSASPTKAFPPLEHSARDETKRSSLLQSTGSTDISGISAKRASFEGSNVKVKETVATSASESKTVTVSPPLDSAKKGSFHDEAGLSLTSPSKPTVTTPPSIMKSHVADSSATPKVEGGASVRITIASSTGSTSSASTSVTTPTVTSSTSTGQSGGENKKDGLRQTDGETAAFSPKDEYKLRRQNRSKTLPGSSVGKDEQFATKVQRTASHRAEPANSQNASPEVSPRVRFITKTGSGADKEKLVEPATKSEPEWFALARRKTGRHEEKEEKSEAAVISTPAKDTAPTKESLSISMSELPSKAPKSETVSSVKPEAVTSVRSESAASLKSEPVTSSAKTETVSSPVVSSTASRSEKALESKSNDVTRSYVRGGSVKTSPTKSYTGHVFSNRGSSVKVTSTKSTPVSQTPITSTSAAKRDVKEEPKTSEPSPAKEVPKWKSQSVKATSSSSATPSSTPVSSSRFGSIKTQPTSPTPPASSPSTTKMEPKPTSPVKTHLQKAGSVDTASKEEKDSSSVPAWRANLKKHDIKIELIETKSSTTVSTTSSQKKDDAAKQLDSPAKTGPGNKELQTDQCRGSASNRSSKVLDLVKNFQNLQVS